MINDDIKNFDDVEKKRLLLTKLIVKKAELRNKTKEIFDEIRMILKAPRVNV